MSFFYYFYTLFFLLIYRKPVLDIFTIQDSGSYRKLRLILFDSLILNPENPLISKTEKPVLSGKEV